MSSCLSARMMEMPDRWIGARTIVFGNSGDRQDFLSLSLSLSLPMRDRIDRIRSPRLNEIDHTR